MLGEKGDVSKEPQHPFLFGSLEEMYMYADMLQKGCQANVVATFNIFICLFSGKGLSLKKD